MAEKPTSKKTRGAASNGAAAERADLGGPDSGSTEPENSIRPSRQRTREPAATKTTESAESREAKRTPDRARGQASSSGTPERLIPDHVRKRFVQVGHRYYFSDGAHAFTDRGTRLVTPARIPKW